MTADPVPTCFASRRLAQQQRAIEKAPKFRRDDAVDGAPPTKILSIAIRKRRELFDEKEPSMRRELQHKVLIQHLCKYLGDSRAARKRRQRRSKSRKYREGAEEQEEEAQNIKQIHETEADDSLHEMEALGMRPTDQWCPLKVTEPNFPWEFSASPTPEPCVPVCEAEPNAQHVLNTLSECNSFDGYSGFWSDSEACNSSAASSGYCSAEDSLDSIDSSTSNFSVPLAATELKENPCDSSRFTQLRPLKRRWNTADNDAAEDDGQAKRQRAPSTAFEPDTNSWSLVQAFCSTESAATRDELPFVLDWPADERIDWSTIPMPCWAQCEC